MLLLYSAGDAGPEMGSPEQAAEMPKWMAYTQDMAEAGVLLGGDPLHGIETATTLRSTGSQIVATDGPFAETKELLGGYYMIEVEDLTAATHWAEKCPILAYGSVELRPIMEIPGA